MIRQISLQLTLAVLILILCISACSAQAPPGEVVLDADEVTYNESTGIGTARGDARLKRGTMTLSAPYLEIDSNTNTVRGSSEIGKPVTIKQGQKTLRGSSLEYDLTTREGVLYGAEGTVPAQKGYVYMDGGRVKIAPSSSEEGREITGSRKEGEPAEDTFVGSWEDVTLTTCTEQDPLPHYRIVTHKLVIIPGRRVIAKTPDVYLGKHKLFRYPFDYIVDLREKKHTTFMPAIVYDTDKGIGLGIKPRYLIDDRSSLELALTQWSDTGFEWKGTVRRDLGEGFSVFGRTGYEYDTDVKTRAYRPSWGLEWEKNEWQADLVWSQREPRDTEKRSGNIYRTTLWRDPEFTFHSPWWDDPASRNTQWSISGSWGNFEERQKTTTRKSWGFHLRGDSPLGDGISQYWRGNYRYYDYSQETTQRVTDFLYGLRYPVGNFALSTSYYRRWTDGESPLWWDDYDESEKIYQQLGFSATEDLYIIFRTSYNLFTEDFDERIYELSLDRDCLRWVFLYRDHLAEDNDDWAAVRLVIKAFPDTDLSIDSRQVDDSYR